MKSISTYWNALSSLVKGIVSIAAAVTILYNVYTWTSNRAVNKYKAEVKEVAKDTTLTFLSKQVAVLSKQTDLMKVDIFDRLENIEGMIRMQTTVIGQHSADLKAIRSSVIKLYMTDDKLTKKDLMEALEELKPKETYKPEYIITPIR
jgi:hypothetical protein